MLSVDLWRQDEERLFGLSLCLDEPEDPLLGGGGARVEIHTVAPGSAAEQAGARLAQGDTVILRCHCIGCH